MPVYLAEPELSTLIMILKIPSHVCMLVIGGIIVVSDLDT